MAANKEITIEEIKFYIVSGLKYSEILGINEQKWKLPVRTFARFYKKAGEKINPFIQETKEKVKALQTEILTRAENAYLTRAERLTILSNIANGTTKVETKVPKWDTDQKKYVLVNIDELPNFTQRISAISEINKMDGGYAPVKTAFTDAEGNAAPAPGGNALFSSKEEFIALIDEINKK